MLHEPWIELVSAAADQQLDATERAILDEHLRTCGSCRELLAGFERDRRMSRLHTAAASPDLLRSIAEARDDDRIASRRAQRTLIRRGLVASSLTAAAMIGVVTIARPTAPVDPPQPAHERNLVMVDAQNQTFDRAEIEVSVGATVEWRNPSATKHQLIRKLGAATVEEELSPGQTESATFTEPGTYEFSCAIHPEMTGSVTVDA